MDIIIMDVRYKIAKAAYIGAGGDPNRQFNSVEEIYAATEKLYGESSSRVTIEPLSVEITSNGVYEYNDDISGYKPVSVNVNVDVGTAYEDGYNNGVIDGQEMQKQKLSDITISSNGIYDSVDGYKLIDVKVPMQTDYTKCGLLIETSNALNAITEADFEYTKSIIPEVIDKTSRQWRENREIAYIPTLIVNTSNLSDWCTYCYNLKVFEGVTSTQKITSCASMFMECGALQYVGWFDTSNVTDAFQLFKYCYSLKTIPQLDTSKVTRFASMCAGCYCLKEVPHLDTSSATNIQQMFSNCKSLKTIPQLDTSKVTNMQQTLEYCTNLESVPLLDCSLVSMFHIFGGSITLSSLVDLGGFKNLGAVENITATISTFKMVPNITKQSLMNIINNLYDRAAAGYSTKTIQLHSNHLVLLTNEDIAIATNKGWIIS